MHKIRTVIGWKEGVVLVLGLVLAVKTGINVVKLVGFGDRLKLAEKEFIRVKSENSSLKSKLAEVESDDFLEKEAREKFGLGKEGEEVVIVPTLAPKNGRVEETLIDNWKKWWKLYVGE